MYGFLKRKFVLVSVKTVISMFFIHLFSIRVVASLITRFISLPGTVNVNAVNAASPASHSAEFVMEATNQQGIIM